MCLFGAHAAVAVYVWSIANVVAALVLHTMSWTWPVGSWSYEDGSGGSRSSSCTELSWCTNVDRFFIRLASHTWDSKSSRRYWHSAAELISEPLSALAAAAAAAAAAAVVYCWFRRHQRRRKRALSGFLFRRYRPIHLIHLRPPALIHWPISRRPTGGAQNFRSPCSRMICVAMF